MPRGTYINTAEGKTRVEWWEESDFHGRSNRIGDLDTGEIISVIPIPDDCILCDFCNEEITEFPVPVLWGTHAACKKCFEDMQRTSKEHDNGNG